jgi:hypothetical protein
LRLFFFPVTFLLSSSAAWADQSMVPPPRSSPPGIYVLLDALSSKVLVETMAINACHASQPTKLMTAYIA